MDMRALLQEKWELGPRLADVFLAYYGGHVHTASQALAALAFSPDKFECQSVANIEMSSLSIATCLRTFSDDAQAALMLRDLAMRGFAPVYEHSHSHSHMSGKTAWRR